MIQESAAILICKDLLEEGANLIIRDPKVDKSQIKNDLEKVFKQKIVLLKVMILTILEMKPQ